MSRKIGNKKAFFNNDLGEGRKHPYYELHGMVPRGEHAEAAAWKVSFAIPCLEGFWEDEIQRCGYVELQREVITNSTYLIGTPHRRVKSAIIRAKKIDRSHWRTIGLSHSKVEKLGTPIMLDIRASMRLGSDDIVPIELGTLEACAQYDRALIWNKVETDPAMVGDKVLYRRLSGATLVAFQNRKSEPLLTLGKWRSHGIHQSQVTPRKFAY